MVQPVLTTLPGMVLCLAQEALCVHLSGVASLNPHCSTDVPKHIVSSDCSNCAS